MGGSQGTAEPQKGEKVALGTVQSGYKISLYVYPVWNRTESDYCYADLLAELTTELELACKSDDGETAMEEEAGEDSELTEAHSERKKEWEELLEQSELLEAMLRQMLENGLGQQREEQQKPPKKKEEEEPDNSFEQVGIPAPSEGKQRTASQKTDYHGNSEFLQQNAGESTEYFSASGAGRQRAKLYVMCLSCETDCDRKKQWKITQ